MKNLSLFVSFFALCTSTSYAAINCGTLPTCESLGYNDIVANCPNSNKVIRCPFDKDKGKCLHTAEIGDVKYSLNTSDHDGWLLCDGRILVETDYPLLKNVIGHKFCNKFTNKTQQAYSSSLASKGAYVGNKCGAGKFALPDYRGFYLRSMMTQRTDSDTIDGSGNWYSNALKVMGGAVNEWDNYHTEHTPMFARLPNIMGYFSGVGQSFSSGDDMKNTVNGAFYIWNKADKPAQGAKVRNNDGDRDDVFGFNASLSNPIYSSASPYVIPASYGIYTFIYAGKK